MVNRLATNPEEERHEALIEERNTKVSRNYFQIQCLVPENAHLEVPVRLDLGQEQGCEFMVWGTLKFLKS